MPIRGLNYVAQAISQANEQLGTYKKQSRLRHNDVQSQELSAKELQIAEDLEQQIYNSDTARSGFQCPCCEQEMIRLQHSDMELDYCMSCRSLWFDKGELKALLLTRKDIPSDHLRSRNSHYDCPHCHILMREYVFLNPHNLLVDSCPQCHGILLEDDELERAFTLS